MARVVLTFASTHAAMAAEDALRDVGIALQVVPLPTWVAVDCGLALRLDGADVGRAVQELMGRKIQVQGVHAEPTDSDPLVGFPGQADPWPGA